jgi:mono/diheme cytochrome c family protein
MIRARVSFVGTVLLVVWAAGLATVSPHVSAQATRGASSQSGWTIPATADAEKSPLAVNDSVVAAGRKLFASKCQRCHGSLGKGDGVDADKKYQKDMNLTLATRAADNPEGVMFYKIWNGRSSPKMPRFSEEFSREQVWALVAYVQTLRAK